MKPKRTPSRNAKSLEVTWYGHSAFLLKADAGPSVLIDPWLDNPKAPAGAKDVSPVDLILISHGHSDHVGNTIEVAKRTGAPVVSIHEVSLYLQSQGIGDARGMNKGGTISFPGVEVTMVDARHSGDVDLGGRVVPGGEAAGFVVHFEKGMRVYHAGDTSVFGDMTLIQKMYKPDLVLLPIGGLYTMAPREAAVACTMLKPRFIIGMHYGTFPPLVGNPSELMRYLPSRLRKAVRELEPGKTVRIS